MAKMVAREKTIPGRVYIIYTWNHKNRNLGSDRTTLHLNFLTLSITFALLPPQSSKILAT